MPSFTIKEQIKFEDFTKVDIRVGTILSAENVENSEKLIKLQVDFGELGERQVLTGLQMHYKAEDFVGMQTIFLVNLPERKMAGEPAQAMILALGLDHSKRPIFMVPKENVKNGEGLN